jgi:hypothetical protein
VLQTVKLLDKNAPNGKHERSIERKIVQGVTRKAMGDRGHLQNTTSNASISATRKSVSAKKI